VGTGSLGFGLAHVEILQREGPRGAFQERSGTETMSGERTLASGEAQREDNLEDLCGCQSARPQERPEQENQVNEPWS